MLSYTYQLVAARCYLKDLLSHLHILSERLSYLEKEMSLENYRIFANMIVGQFTLYNPSNRLWKSVIQINGDILTGTISSVTLSI